METTIIKTVIFMQRGMCCTMLPVKQFGSLLFSEHITDAAKYVLYNIACKTFC
jgi:hypothetical protein